VTKPLLCVTVTAPTMAVLRQRRDAVEHADLVELRLDSVSDPDVTGALSGRRLPVILTCRPSWEGGQFRGSEDERRGILQQSIAGGAEYTDLEWKAGFADLIEQTGGRRIVLSSHDFERMPPDLPERLRAMRATGAEVVKLAGAAARLTDCLPLLALGRAAAGERVVLIAMGERGLATRVLAARFGSAWTYAGSMTDIGQLSADRLVNEYRYRCVTQSTNLFGVVGLPVAHSVSPAMHNAALASAGVDGVYVPLPAADADDFVEFGRALQMKGASITIPYKTALLDRVEAVDDVARKIGAINTIRADGQRWTGANSDAAGFLRPLRDRSVTLAGKQAAILGSGGSARAVAVALGEAGARVTVHGRDQARAEAVASLAGGRVAAWPPAKDSWDLLINCTPVGMFPRVDDSPLAAEALTGRLVYDLVYNPPTTRLLREAQRAGCQVIGGLDMLVGQALQQFEWWTGVRPPAGVMRAAAERRLAEFATDENHVV
jgi:3-dehydroquinate dehydratase/shikimate dehydrogenase